MEAILGDTQICLLDSYLWFTPIRNNPQGQSVLVHSKHFSLLDQYLTRPTTPTTIGGVEMSIQHGRLQFEAVNERTGETDYTVTIAMEYLPRLRSIAHTLAHAHSPARA